MQDKQQVFFLKRINHQGSFLKSRCIFTNVEILSNSKDLLLYSAFVPEDHAGIEWISMASINFEGQYHNGE